MQEQSNTENSNTTPTNSQILETTHEENGVVTQIIVITNPEEL